MPAATINFPDTIPNPEYPLGEDVEDSVLRSNFEDGTVQTRQKFTRVRTTFSVQWGNLPDEHKQTLEIFIKPRLRAARWRLTGHIRKAGRLKPCALPNRQSLA